MSNEINVPIEATVEAKVFRLKPKPRLIPYRLWRLLAKTRLRIFGKWEDMGLLTRVDLGK